MKTVETDAFNGYQQLIRQNQALIRSKALQGRIKIYLEKIASEEKKHIGLVEELIDILKKQPK